MDQERINPLNAISEANEIGNSNISASCNTYRKINTGDDFKIFLLTIFWSQSVVTIIGVIGNMCVVFDVILVSKLHTPTYIAIAELALADSLSLIGHYFHVINVVWYNMADITIKILYIVQTVFANSSLVHLMLLTVARYIITVYPLKSILLLSPKRLIVMSILVWIYSVCFGIGIVQVYSNSRLEDHVIIESARLIYMILIPVMIISILQILKFRHLKNSKAAVSGNFLKRTSKIVGFILVTYVVLATPYHSMDLLLMQFSCGHWKDYLNFTSSFLFIVNNAINPIIYFYFSPAFLQSLRKCHMCK